MGRRWRLLSGLIQRSRVSLMSCLVIHLLGAMMSTHGAMRVFSLPDHPRFSGYARESGLHSTTGQQVDLDFEIPMGVTLDSFHAHGIEGAIVVEWSTSDEEDCVGFNLWRSLHPSQEQTLVTNAPVVPMGVGHTYRITDTDVVHWLTYWYELEVLLEGGGSTRFGFIAAQPQPESSYLIYLPVVQKVACKEDVSREP